MGEACSYLVIDNTEYPPVRARFRWNGKKELQSWFSPERLREETYTVLNVPYIEHLDR